MNKNYWCGIRGVYQIWHGQWADPEVRYKNYICNEWDLQESMYIAMKDRIADGEDWGDPDNDNDFMNFCKQNADLVKQDIIELSAGGVYESKKTMLSKDKSLLESLTKKYGRNALLNEVNKNVREGYSSKFQIAENWFSNLHFRDLERLTGIFWDDFLNGYDEDDSEEADENFLAACDEWWNENSPSEKVEIMNQWNNGEW